MMDHHGYKGSEVGDEMRSCADCGTTKTPLWRSGPAGPKSLCNACGIKSRKKRSVLGVTKSSSSELKKAKKVSISFQSTSSSSSSSNHQSYRNKNISNSHKLSQPLKKKLVPLGHEVVFQRSIAERLRKRLGEEEQAAMLLMAISCGYVY